MGSIKREEKWRDRGNIKWTSLILPEHRALLQELKIEEQRIDPPIKCIEVLADLAEQIRWAKQQKREVIVTFWKDYQKHVLMGRIEDVDYQRKKILLVDSCSAKHWISAKLIYTLD